MGLDPSKKQFKQFVHSVKGLDADEGIVIAYANAYDNEDSDGDISAPGSFDKTVNERYKKLRVFKNHDSRIELGVPAEKPKTDDPYGLLTTTQFNMEKQESREMFSDAKLKMKYGFDVDLSIGYAVVKRDDKNKKRITEYALWEYSFLSNWGANPRATAQGIKGLNKDFNIIEFLVDAYDLQYSDSRLINIEKILKSLDGQKPGPPLLPEQPTAEQISELIKTAFTL